MTRCFVVVKSPWNNKMIERMTRKAVCTLKVLLNEGPRPLAGWVQVVPAVQWALNTVYRGRTRCV